MTVFGAGAADTGRVDVRHVLCPVDLSETSRRALNHARALASWYDATLTVLEVIWAGLPPIALPATVTANSRHTFLTPDERAQFETELKAFCAEAGEGAECDTKIVEGAVLPAIVAAARDLPADLIVLGTHGMTGFDKLLLGSVTDKVLRKAPCPVLTIPPSALVVSRDGRYRTIVCALDFSPASRHALRYALSLAQETQAALLLVHVVEWPWSDGAAAEPEAAADFRRSREEEADRYMRGLLPASARDWCRPEMVTSFGSAHEQIVRIASDRRADLIVLGVHGRSALNLAVFGSTANQVIRHSQCPVLTVRL